MFCVGVHVLSPDTVVSIHLCILRAGKAVNPVSLNLWAPEKAAVHRPLLDQVIFLGLFHSS